MELRVFENEVMKRLFLSKRRKVTENWRQLQAWGDKKYIKILVGNPEHKVHL
jgi:hypothetical protein